MTYEREWKALEVGNTVGDRTFYEAHFHYLLAAKLEASGYGIRRTEHHFELSSVSRELLEKFSRRTKLIEERARESWHQKMALENSSVTLMPTRRTGVSSTQSKVIESDQYSGRFVSAYRPDFSDQRQEDRNGQNAAQGVTEKLLRTQPERAARQFFKFRVVPSCTGK
jgi:hypothetical protein